jgi:predicted transcriptional regulator
MRIRHAVVEYDLEEVASMLGISPGALKQAVSTGHLQYYYRLGEGDYRFHEASLRTNKDLLSQEDDLTKVLSMCSSSETTTEPDASEEDPPSTPSDP